MRARGYRVLGPYRDGKRWRIILAGPGGVSGVRDCQYFASREAAAAMMEALRRNLPGGITVRLALERYKAHLASEGNRGRPCRPQTVALTADQIGKLLELDLEIERLTPEAVEQSYAARVAAVAADTQRNELAVLKTFLRWCAAEGLIRRSPAEGVRPRGERHHGKAQLRAIEARAFADHALELAQGGDEAALAALLVLSLGVRAGELLDRKVRDLDHRPGEGWSLCIDRGKTRAARRELRIPDHLAALLLARISQDDRDAWLWPSSAEGGHRTRTWLLRSVRSLCQAAGVPVVCPHGLRGTYASLATSADATSLAVSRSLGHEHEQITLDAYTHPDAVEAARSRRVLRALEPTDKAR
jgi:integrase